MPIINVHPSDRKIIVIAKVLLVEDTPSLARVYAEYLKKAAFTVETVETGAAALEALRKPCPRSCCSTSSCPT